MSRKSLLDGVELEIPPGFTTVAGGDHVLDVGPSLKVRVTLIRAPAPDLGYMLSIKTNDDCDALVIAHDRKPDGSLAGKGTAVLETQQITIVPKGRRTNRPEPGPKTVLHAGRN